MPAPRADLDRDALATSIALHGPRETHRRTGVPLGTIARIAKAAGVKSPDHLTRTVPITAVRRTDDAQRNAVHVGTPSHAIVTDALTEKGARGRLASAHIGCTALETIAAGMDTNPERGIVQLDSALTAGKLLQTANVPGWERQPDRTSTGLVNIAIIGVPPEQIEVQSSTSSSTEQA